MFDGPGRLRCCSPAALAFTQWPSHKRVPLLGQAFFRFVNGQLGRLQHALDSHYSVRDTDLDGWDQLWEIAVYVHTSA